MKTDSDGVNETDQRPWGGYVVLADEADHKVKRIAVLPGKRLSLQRHARRSEHWYFEVQRGDYLGEDDIERFEDDYGRCDAC